MGQATSPGVSPWDLPVARRPVASDFNSITLEDDPENPAPPGDMITAPQWNTKDALLVSLGRMIPNARLTIQASAPPAILGCTSAGNTLSSANFVATRNGAGDYSITYAEPAGTTTWAGSTAYSTGAFVRPPVPTGFYYKATSGGTSAVSPAVWPVVVGGRVTDGSVTWTCWGAITPMPESVGQPSAACVAPAGPSSNQHAASAVNIQNGVRVTTALNGTLTDLNFNVSLW